MFVSRRGFVGSLLALLGVNQLDAQESSKEFEIEHFFIAGFRFHEGPRLLGRMQPGDRLAVLAEPENPYDSGAVRLEFAGRHIGYVPQARNSVVGRLLAQQAPLCGRILTVDPAAEPWRTVEVAVVVRAGHPS